MSSMGLYSRKFFLVCSCFYLLAATGSTTNVLSEDKHSNGKRFLRSGALATEAADVPMISKEDESATASDVIDSDAVDSSSSSSSEAVVTEPSIDKEEEFDYETYHAKHNIPVPALGATMMGLMNTASTNDDNTTPQSQQYRVIEEENTIRPRGIFSFAGTNEAIRQYASEIVDGDDTIKEEDIPPSSINNNNNNNNAQLYMSTLAQISKSRLSLLYGSDSSEEVEKDDASEEVEKDDSPSKEVEKVDPSEELERDDSPSKEVEKDDASEEVEKDDFPSKEVAKVDPSEELERDDSPSKEVEKDDSSSETIIPTTFNEDSHLENKDPTKDMANLKKPLSPLPRTNSDLDRGRHLVGLEVREVRPHQQIIIDYENASEEVDEQQPMKPIRIRYLLSEEDNKNNSELNTDANNKIGDLEDKNNLKLLSTLLDTSFNRTANLWSQALSLPRAIGNITPTVDMCGSARIPALHKEEGVENADIVIYVSGDNRFCGGALMHSAICDFDQNMRPLVANINICTKKITMATVPDHDGVQILTPVLNDYDEFITTETARLLGASTSLFRHYQNPDTDTPYGSYEKLASCVDGTQETISVPNIISEEVDLHSGQVYYEIRTPKVIEVVKNNFDCMTVTGARLEVKRGSLSCFGGFLDQRLFFGEQVSGFQVPAKDQGATLSPLTLALLEDSSWYAANYTVSTELPFGRGGGCEFAGGDCAVDDDSAAHVSTHGKGFHCTVIGKMGCDASHSFKAKCDLLDFVAMTSTVQSSIHQVCPMHIRGAINCAGPSDSLLAHPGEVYGESSKCFLTDEGQPLCLQGTCNVEKQSIDVNYENKVFTCLHDGQIIDTNMGLRIECPRIAAVCPSLICPSNCSGRGVCDEDREGKHSCICDDPFDDTLGCWGS